jgi:UDP-3-O-[3-hydroxymyristoyl] glucosamine N-acyltransferase
MSLTAAELARQLQAELTGNPATPLTGFAPADQARAGDVTYAESEPYFAVAARSAAAAIITAGNFTCAEKVVFKVGNARVAFARALALFHPEPVRPALVHPTAVIAPDAQVDATAHIGPHCVVGARTRIGARTALLAGVVVAEDCRVGAECVVFPNVTIYARTTIGERVRIHAGSVIGADGFGYVLDGDAHCKVPQIGQVIIGDDVEIGANTTIDRGALGTTVIGRGTKIDNLVQVAHNVKIGDHSILTAQVGVAGSSRLGRHNMLGGQAGVADHLTLGDHVKVAAKSGVIHDIPAGESWFGYPAQPDRQTKRQFLALQRLPQLLRRVAELERQLHQAAAKNKSSDPA